MKNSNTFDNLMMIMIYNQKIMAEIPKTAQTASAQSSSCYESQFLGV